MDKIDGEDRYEILMMNSSFMSLSWKVKLLMSSTV